MDCHSKSEVIEIYHYEWKRWYCLTSFLKPTTSFVNFKILEKWSYDISRDLLTQYLYFEMLTTISSFVCQILIPAP